MLQNLRNSLETEKRKKASRERGKILEMRRRAIKKAELTFVNSSLTIEEQERMISQKLEAIRRLEVRRANELSTQIEVWDDDDFQDATILIGEDREDRELLDALEKENNLLNWLKKIA